MLGLDAKTDMVVKCAEKGIFLRKLFGAIIGEADVWRVVGGGEREAIVWDSL